MDPRILDGISGASAAISVDKSCPDDDTVDRINHTYTPNILMFFTAVVLSRQLVVKPISCWIPNDFTGAQGEYAETVCWVTSTYFIPMAQGTVPLQEDLRYEKRIYYYQWVPFILMVQAALFVVPCIIWRLFSVQSRLNIRTVMEVSRELKSVSDSWDRRRDLICCLVRHLEDALMMRHFRRQHRAKKSRPADPRLYGRGWAQLASGRAATQLPPLQSGLKKTNPNKRFSTPVVPLNFSRQSRVPGPRPCSPASSAFLSGLYLTVKALYLANSATQLCLTGKCLNGHTFIFGIEALRDLMDARFWDTTGSFPRVALCDFELRRMGSNQHRYTIQCVLRINIFNEKIYIFLWFWFFFVSVLNLLSFLRWFHKLMFPSVRMMFIRNLICIHYNISASRSRYPLKHSDNNSKTVTNTNSKRTTKEETIDWTISDVFKTPSELQDSRTFTEDILGQDGVLLLRFISMNVSPTLASELAGSIWVKYRKTASANTTALRYLEDVVLVNMTTEEGEEVERPPAVPPKRRPHGARETPHKKLKNSDNNAGVLVPLSVLNHQNKAHHENDSDRSSESSRPTIEMLQERSRYRSKYSRRGNYSTYDEEEVEQDRRTFDETGSFDGFVDFHCHDNEADPNNDSHKKDNATEVYIPGDAPSEDYRDDRISDFRSFENF